MKTARMNHGRSIQDNLRCAFLFWGIVLAGLLGSSNAVGQVKPHTGHKVGKVNFVVSCSKEAQAKFNYAVGLLHHMTYTQAREAFEQTAAADPQCAMAYWGIAITLFQPLWPTRPSPADLNRGWELVLKARSIPNTTERERLFISAAESFFLEPASSDYWLRIRRWEQTMEKVYSDLPDDNDAAAFYALAHLAITPANTISRTNADRAAAVLLEVYKRDPDHPGTMHYLVHASDVPGREKELLEITQKYDSIAPRNPHALHMPTHIYTRLGNWDAVISGNTRAAEAALEYPAGTKGEFVWDEFAHAIEYMIYAHLQKGADDAAAIQLKRMQAATTLEPTFKTAFHLSSSQARYALERRDWKAATALVPREPANLNWDRATWPESITVFARGLGAAHLGKLDDARAAAQRLEKLEESTVKMGEDLFSRNIKVLRLELNAWIAHVEGQKDASLALMQEAARFETSTPKHSVTPGPTLPGYELLGDLLWEQNSPADALAAYKRSLELYPKRFNSLLGAARSARKLGNRSAAQAYYKELLEGVANGGRVSEINEARSFLALR